MKEGQCPVTRAERKRQSITRLTHQGKGTQKGGRQKKRGGRNRAPHQETRDHVAAGRASGEKKEKRMACAAAAACEEERGRREKIARKRKLQSPLGGSEENGLRRQSLRHREKEKEKSLFTVFHVRMDVEEEVKREKKTA